MEDSVKDPSFAPGRSSSKLRYPLRSATKSKEEKPPTAKLSNSSASNKERSPSSVSKSMGVLDLPGKDKSGKPPRRLSIPAKSNVSSASRSIGNITPISEVRAKRSAASQAKNDTPVSDVCKSSSSRRKFSVLSTASYWLSQIKLSEAAAKHTISLGFFKLALEAGCEPLQRMKDELKSYALRHNLAELGEPAKELFERYNVLENFGQLQASETCSQVIEEGTHSSDDDAHSSSVTGTRKIKPKSLNTDGPVQPTPVTEPAKKGATQKANPGTRTRGSLSRNSASSRNTSGTAGRSISKKLQKPSKQESDKDNDKIEDLGKQGALEQVGPVDSSPTVERLQENKENTDAPQMEEISMTEV